MGGRCLGVDRVIQFAHHAAGARRSTHFHRRDKPHARGLSAIIHQPVADFVRSRVAAVGYGRNSHEFRYRRGKPHARGLSPRGAAPSGSSLGSSDTPWRRPAVGRDGGPALEDGPARPSGNALADSTIPGDDWSVEALGLRAQHELARIAADECQVTPAYWLLGKALNAARKHFPKKGTWENWLRARGIGEDRAQKARRLATFFASRDDLAGLSLREALRLAKGGTPNPATAKLLRNIDRRMRNAIQAARLAGKKVERGEECQLTEGETS